MLSPPTARAPKRCLAIALIKDWGRSTRRNASLEGVDSSERADMIEGPIHRRVPPAKRLCTPRGRLSKPSGRELIESSGLETVLVECVGCKPVVSIESRRRRRVGELARIQSASDRRTIVVRPKADHWRDALSPSQGLRTFPIRTGDGHSQRKRSPPIGKLTSSTVACLSCRGNAKQLGDLDTAALRTVGHVTSAADQGLEHMVARLT